jgi:hypothetical protein
MADDNLPQEQLEATPGTDKQEPHWLNDRLERHGRKIRRELEAEHITKLSELEAKIESYKQREAETAKRERDSKIQQFMESKKLVPFNKRAKQFILENVGDFFDSDGNLIEGEKPWEGINNFTREFGWAFKSKAHLEWEANPEGLSFAEWSSRRQGGLDFKVRKPNDPLRGREYTKTERYSALLGVGKDKK